MPPVPTVKRMGSLQTVHGTLPSKIPARSACGKVSKAHKRMKPSAKPRNRQGCRYDRFRHRERSVAICISFYRPEKLQTAPPHRYHPRLVATLVILSLFCEESVFLLIDPSRKGTQAVASLRMTARASLFAVIVPSLSSPVPISKGKCMRTKWFRNQFECCFFHP